MRHMRSALLAVASCVVATCTSLNGASRPHYGGVLKVNVSAALTRLEIPEANPSWEQKTVRDELLRLVYDRLTNLDDSGRIVPMLVTGWEHSPDFKRWTFALRKNIELHDGSMLTSADVVAALSQANPAWHVLAAVHFSG